MSRSTVSSWVRLRSVSKNRNEQSIRISFWIGRWGRASHFAVTTEALMIVSSLSAYGPLRAFGMFRRSSMLNPSSMIVNLLRSLHLQKTMWSCSTVSWGKYSFRIHTVFTARARNVTGLICNALSHQSISRNHNVGPLIFLSPFHFTVNTDSSYYIYHITSHGVERGKKRYNSGVKIIMPNAHGSAL